MTPEQLFAALGDGEGADLECKLADGGLPKSMWETVSAFANTDGGLLLLGVSERSGRFQVEGVRKLEALQAAFWDGHNNPQKLSRGVCGSADVTVLDIDGRSVLSVHVSRVARAQRPIFINGNPLTGTYKRHHSGDYRCTEDEVRQMLRDASDDPPDSEILEGFDLDDLDPETLSAYRNRLASRDPDHPFLAQSETGFLDSLGALRRDRRSGREGITLAGLLMFGKERALLDELPRYQLDYQEQLSSDPEVRWTYRLTLDGKWVPNLFNFYYRVFPRLAEGVDLPFKLDRHGTRVEETHVHEALREALVNALVHADHRSSLPTLIVKTKHAFEFANPGRLRVPREQLYRGGVSDPRNPTLQKMFQLIGLSERAGSGLPKILRAWREQDWLRPLISEDLEREQTRFLLPMSSMVPADVEHELRSVVGDAYGVLDELSRWSLILAHRFGAVSNEDVQGYRDEHPRVIGECLSRLAAAGWLRKDGQGRGTRYRWPARDAGDLLARAGGGNEQPSGLPGVGSEHLVGSSEHLAASSEHLAGSSEHLGLEFSRELVERAALVRDKGKVARTAMEACILDLCTGRWLSLQQLATLLGRKSDSLRNHYITPMLADGRLEARVRDAKTHPGQAYRRV